MTQGRVIFSLVRVGIPYPSFCIEVNVVRQGDVVFTHYSPILRDGIVAEKPAILKSCKFDPEPTLVKYSSEIILCECKVDTLVNHPDHPTVKLKAGNWWVDEVEGRTQYVPPTDFRD